MIPQKCPRKTNLNTLWRRATTAFCAVCAAAPELLSNSLQATSELTCAFFLSTSTAERRFSVRCGDGAKARPQSRTQWDVFF